MPRLTPQQQKLLDEEIWNATSQLAESTGLVGENLPEVRQLLEAFWLAGTKTRLPHSLIVFDDEYIRFPDGKEPEKHV